MSTLLHGFNGGVSFAGIHDSSEGWYEALTFGLTYELSPRYSADASFSFYPYRLATNTNPATDQRTRLVPTYVEPGDTLLSVHARFNARRLYSTSTVSLTLPSGDKATGLSTGRVTFDFDEDLESYVHRAILLVNLGGGDSSTLINPLVIKDYSSLGALAHFQAGVGFRLPRSSYFRSTAYEQLPIGDQKIYTTLPSMPGAPPRTVVTGRNISEDNGFTNSVNVPLTSHLVFQSYYNRSLRLHLDTASVGFTYVFRRSPVLHKHSLIDKALREAEGLAP